MKVDLECNIEILNDALAQGSFTVLCEFYKKCIEILSNGGKVCLYDEYLPPVNYRINNIFSDLDDFKDWFNQHYPNLDCEE